jgi:hypothetical protein
MAKRKYYKILKDGRSFCGGRLTWSLPSRGKPGDWHEVEGELVRCCNGLHLTSEPIYMRSPGTICYEAEYEGDAIGPFHDELVVRRCRLVRRVPWPEFRSEEKPDPEPAKDSEAMQLLRHVWKSVRGHTWRAINDSMQHALRLAIESGMQFGPDDFAEIDRDFSAGYWLGIEMAYARACDGPHGPNASAYQAIEKRLGRKPFIVHSSAKGKRWDPDSPPGPKVRLRVGTRFDWHINLKDRVVVEVTSFNDEEKSLIACSYKEAEPDKCGERKIDRRFRITHEDIAAYHAAIREFRKSRTEQTETAAASSE